MICDEADEVVLETEVTNTAALMLYERLGFLRDKRLFRKLFIKIKQKLFLNDKENTFSYSFEID